MAVQRFFYICYPKIYLMTFLYKPTLLLFVLLLIFTSCDKKEKTIFDTTADPVDTFVKFTAYQPKKVSIKSEAHKKNEIEHFYDKVWSAKSNSTISFLVAEKGKILFEDYQGYSNKREGEKIDKNTALHLASVSKVITAAAILKLVDAKKIALDQEVRAILKDFQYPGITIQMLLNHRSGLQNYAYVCDDRKIWDQRVPLTNHDILTVFNREKIGLASKPDTKFAYCNTNYAVLALVIEKITGLPYPQAMDRMIFQPLEMKNTFVFDINQDKDKVSVSYKNNYQAIAFDYLDGIYGDKNIYSTPRDMLKFNLASQGPDFLSKELTEKVLQGYSHESKGMRNYGLGIRIIEWNSGERFYYHNGWWHGNTSSYVSLRKEGVLMIALSNKYSTKPYEIRKLSPLFGTYPFPKDHKD